jgi:hypothetical membrane protein
MKEIKNIGQRAYAFLTRPDLVRKSTIAGFSIYSLAIIIGYIVAQFDPQGYNPLKNYISDMGSFRHTPFPYLLDFGCMITSFLLLPTILYMEKILAPLPEKAENLPVSRMRLRLGSYGFFWMIIGLIGMFGVGLFSEDRTTVFGLHWLFTIVVFGGLAIGGIFFGLLILFYDTLLPKLLGLYMVFIPSMSAALAFGLGFPPILEWIMFFSILAYLIVGGLIVLKHINQELAAR